MNTFKSAIIFLFLLCLSSAETKSPSYESFLPKTPHPPEMLLVVDVSQDIDAAEFPQNYEIVFALSSLQGLINRESAEKIYFTGMSMTYYRQPGKELKHGDPAANFLEDGLFRCDYRRVELPAEERFPALAWMVANYAHLLEGKVLAPGVESSDPSDTVTTRRPKLNIESAGARMAAVNACTFENLLFTTPYLQTLWTAWGLDLTTVAETRGLDNSEAFIWSLDRYLDHPRRARTMLGFYGETNTTPVMLDHWVSTYSLVYFLDSRVADNKSLFQRFAATEHFDQGAFHIGTVESGKAIGSIQNVGHQCIASVVPNLSVASSMPHDPEAIPAGPPARPSAIDPNTVYIGLRSVDGDAPSWCYTFYNTLSREGAASDHPLGWSITPAMIDLFPALFEWFAQQSSERIEMIASMNDGGMPHNETGRQAWLEIYDHYLAAAPGAFDSMIYFGPYGPFNDRLHDLIGHRFKTVLRGYHGDLGAELDFDPDHELIEETFYADCLGVTRYHTSFLQYLDAPESFSTITQPDPIYPEHLSYDQAAAMVLKTSIERHAVEGEPFFILHKLPSPHGRHVFNRIETIKELLESDPDIGREVEFLTPSGLAETIRSYNRK